MISQKSQVKILRLNPQVLRPNSPNPNPHQSLTRTTNFRPDHTSSTAQTFTSTSPSFNPKARITFSSRSVRILDDFLGQEIHNMPSFRRHFLLFVNRC